MKDHRRKAVLHVQYSFRCAQSKLYPPQSHRQKSNFCNYQLFNGHFETFKVLSFYIVYSVQWGNFHLLFYLTVSIMVSVRYFVQCVVYNTFFLSIDIEVECLKKARLFPVFWN
jgi:hypothetical protein